MKFTRKPVNVMKNQFFLEIEKSAKIHPKKKKKQ
jgi:hypothetical protein